MSLVYVPLTPLPMETVPDTFVHPAGYCQNVLATGRCWISGTESIGDRPAILVECDHPRTIEVVADRPDFHIQIAVDRADGVILRLVETIGGEVTRRADAVEYAPDAPLPPPRSNSSFRPTRRCSSRRVAGARQPAVRLGRSAGRSPMSGPRIVDPMIVTTTAPEDRRVDSGRRTAPAGGRRRAEDEAELADLAEADRRAGRAGRAAAAASSRIRRDEDLGDDDERRP